MFSQAKKNEMEKSVPLFKVDGLNKKQCEAANKALARLRDWCETKKKEETEHSSEQNNTQGNQIKFKR